MLGNDSFSMRRVAAALLCAGVLVGCGGSKPTLRIESPKNGETIKGSSVKVDVRVQDFKLVDANPTVKPGEGHLHFYIDQPADSIAVGKPIPADPAHIHAGKAPYTSRDLTLNTGQHTITAVMGDSNHVVLASPAPQTITVNVK
ncbi:MAG: hypothetical protein NVS4B8_24050 [Herpetosiphon sp.]